MALYRGWIPSVIGVVPYVGLNFAVYGTMKDVMMSYYGETSLMLLALLRVSVRVSVIMGCFFSASF